MIDYERLEVYQCALEFVRRPLPLRETAGAKGNGDLFDQFRRASLSVVLNIAEGAGKVRQPDKQRFYAISRGAAYECAALLDLFSLLGILQPEQKQEAKSLLHRIISMLSVLSRQERS